MEAESELGSELPALDAELGTRIARVAAMIGSDVEAARVAEISVDTLANYEKLRTGPKLEPLLRLARRANVSISWLIAGEGSMNSTDTRGTSDEDVIALPRYDVSAAAGTGLVVNSERVVDWVYFRRDWLHKELGVNPSRLVIITATGDSMAPTLESGDLLLVDIGQPKIRGDGVYVLGIEDEVMVKRIAVKPGGAIFVSADNPLYQHTAEQIARADVRSLHIVGKVVWVGGRI